MDVEEESLEISRLEEYIFLVGVQQVQHWLQQYRRAFTDLETAVRTLGVSQDINGLPRWWHSICCELTRTGEMK